MTKSKRKETREEAAVREAFDRLREKSDEWSIRQLSEKRDNHAATCRVQGCLECKDNAVLLRYHKKEFKIWAAARLKP